MNTLEFRKLLKEECEKENFKRSILKENFKRGRILAKIIIAFEVILIMVDVIASILKVDDRFNFNAYLIMYIVLILISTFLLMMISRFNDLQNAPLKQLIIIDIGLVAYITLVMSWGSILSLMDQRLYGQLMVFMVNMITCSVMFFLDDKRRLVPYCFSVLIISIGLPFFQDSKDVLIGHYVNLCVFLVISWFASKIIYMSYCSDYLSKTMLKKTNALLEREIEHNNNINNKLYAANLQLKELALIDELTGIPNRRSFRNHIEVAFENYVQDDSMLSIILLDIDYFKDFNDRYGHNEGDKVLKAVSNKINSVVRHTMDFAARWGGEEFIYAAFNMNEDEIQKKAETMRSSVFNLRIPHESSRAGEFISVSLGTCSIKISGIADVSRCIELADQALYFAKSSGRNCVKRCTTV